MRNDRRIKTALLMVNGAVILLVALFFRAWLQQKPVNVSASLEVAIPTNALVETNIIHDKGGTTAMAPATSRLPVIPPDPGLPLIK